VLYRGLEFLSHPNCVAVEQRKEKDICMASFRSPSHRDILVTVKSQPGRLGKQDRARRCDWAAGCLAGAVSEHRDHVYCASHLLQTLQQQWQGE
jgi:hypothetical protein